MSKKLYGVYDPVERVWIGTDDGPVSFEDEWTARLCAEIVDVRLEVRRGRHEVRELPPEAYRQRDDVETRITTVEALDKLEKGEV